MKLNKSKNGISLIVLVITIIVMIILATAIILSLSGSDIRNKANEAVSANDISTAKEVISVAQSEWELNYDELSSKYEYFGAYANEKLEKAGINSVKVSKDGAVSTKYTDKNGDIAIVPEGFSVSTVASEKTIDDGLVIVDKDGNEFVWVPVDDITKFKRTTTYTGTITERETNYAEPAKRLCLNYNHEEYECVDTMNISQANDPTGEIAEYNEMLASVTENGGFYIARYEAGKESADIVVSKKGAVVWNEIEWGTSMTEIGTQGAVYRSRQMYKNSKSVVSTLCYGVQWDSALQFIAQKDDQYPTYSTGKGYYAVDDDWVDIEGMEFEVQPAGYFAINNIYDMAGNVQEWTMETYSTYSRCLRGGCYSFPGNYDYASSFCLSTPQELYGNEGFRVALYIK